MSSLERGLLYEGVEVLLCDEVTVCGSGGCVEAPAFINTLCAD